MACIAFWEENVHPITNDKYHNMANRSNNPIKYVKTDDFSTDLYIETKVLMSKYKLNSADLGVKIIELGFDKITCLGRKWVSREIEIHL